MTLSRFFRIAVLTLVLAPLARAGIFTGTVVGPGGVGLVGVELIFSGGVSPTTPLTGPGGVFSMTVPNGVYTVDFLPVDGSGIAPHRIENVVIGTSTSIGTVTLQNGFAITGVALAAGGAPIVGSDIDVFDEVTGMKLYTPGDTTGLLGDFTVLVAPGSYRVRVEPLAGQLLVAQAIEGVVVTNAPVNLGNVTLPVGVALSGVVRNATTLAPLSNVDIDVNDYATGTRVELIGDKTSATGAFSVVVPVGLWDVSIDPPAGALFVARQLVATNVQGTTALGNIDLAPGLGISGTVLLPGGAPAVDMDIDVDLAAGGIRIYTPNDSTDGLGNFQVVVPAGAYRVTVGPLASTGLVAMTTGNVNVSANITLPTFNLAAGHHLTGQVTRFVSMIPEERCKVEVFDATTGIRVPTPLNQTDMNGLYDVVVPAGTYDISYSTDKLSFGRDQVDPGVVVAGPTVRNQNLDIVPILFYVDDPAFPGPQIVPPGSPVIIHVGLYNPTGTFRTANVSVDVLEPNGFASTLLSNSPVTLAPGQLTYALYLPIPLPPTNPGNTGVPLFFRIYGTDPMTGLDVDHDEFLFYRQ